jgi:putative ABC transport system permease protein
MAVVLATSRFLGSLLYRLSPAGPLVLGAACLVLLAVGASAAYLPARRATKIDAAQALRAD